MFGREGRAKVNGKESRNYKVHYIYTVHIEYHSVCPRVGIGTPPSPLGEVRGPRESQFQRLEKSLALCLLHGRKKKIIKGQTLVYGKRTREWGKVQVHGRVRHKRGRESV